MDRQAGARLNDNMADLTRPDELRRAIELMLFAYRGFTERPDRFLERRGLNRVHHRILYFVGRHSEISVGGLLETLSVTKQALNAPLHQLSEMNLIALSVDAEDRRVKRLALTPAGESLEAELTGTQIRRLSVAFEKAGVANEAGWTRVMEILAQP